MTRRHWFTSPKKSRALRASLAFEPLERREVMTTGIFGITGVLSAQVLQGDAVPAQITAAVSGGVLQIQGTNGDDQIVVRQKNGYLSVDGVYISHLGSQLGSVAASAVNSIRVYGYAGNDRIYLNSEAVAGYQAILKQATIFGGEGDDIIVGGAAADTIYGGSGHDRIWGGNGNDFLDGGSGNDQLSGDGGNDELRGGLGNDRMWGGAGHDLLLGGDGNDELVGGDGNDQLNGGAGIDYLWGQAGDDVLISLDNGTSDYVEGGTGRDTYWVDQTGTARDRIVGLESIDKVQAVTGFSNGADRTLNGDGIADPQTLEGHTQRNFAGNPLFSTSGPTLNDVQQGNLANCYVLAGLGAIAKDNPFVLRQNMVDFNDGTFGVRLGNKFYRVDADLAVTSSSSTTPAYARLGAQNSMWVAIAEKAFAHYRKGANTYDSIQWGWPVEMNKAFGSTSAGSKNITSYSSASALANDLAKRLNNKESVTVGFSGNDKKSKDGKLVLAHAYTVVSVTKNSAGAVTSITLRNPWGNDGGDIVDSNPNDGLVTVTPAEIFRNAGQLNWGKV